MIDNYAEPVRAEISARYGDTSDLSEELVNSLANLHYFAIKRTHQNFGGLTDLQEIFPAKSKAELLDLYRKHLEYVISATNQLPLAIERLREIRAQNSELGKVFERVTVDLFKYRIDDALNLTQPERDERRRLATPAEHVGLARFFNLRFEATS